MSESRMGLGLWDLMYMWPVWDSAVLLVLFVVVISLFAVLNYWEWVCANCVDMMMFL